MPTRLASCQIAVPAVLRAQHNKSGGTSPGFGFHSYWYQNEEMHDCWTRSFMSGIGLHPDFITLDDCHCPKKSNINVFP